MQESLTLKEKEKNETLSELSKVKEELKTCQEKEVSASEASPEDKGKKAL
jgi:hypothetical protein